MKKLNKKNLNKTAKLVLKHETIIWLNSDRLQAIAGAGTAAGCSSGEPWCKITEL